MRRSNCPIACTLDILGDKWTLLIIRDILLQDKHLYNDFLHAGEGIPTNILADRLKKLQQSGLIIKQPYQHNPVRYRYLPTPMGRELTPILLAIIKWSNQHIPDTNTPPAGFFEHFGK